MSVICCLDETCGSKSLARVYEEDVKITKKFNRNSIITYKHKHIHDGPELTIIVHFKYSNGQIVPAFIFMDRYTHDGTLVLKKEPSRDLWFVPYKRTVKTIVELIDKCCNELVTEEQEHTLYMRGCQKIVYRHNSPSDMLNRLHSLSVGFNNY